MLVSISSDSPVIAALRVCLANSYALTAITQTAHWNIEGRNFFELHEELGDIYSDLFDSVDEIAERIRQLDSYIVADIAGFAVSSTIKGVAVPSSQEAYITNVMDGIKELVKSFKVLEAVAAKNSDLETQDLGIKRNEVLQKTIWKLRSYLKG